MFPLIVIISLVLILKVALTYIKKYVDRKYEEKFKKDEGSVDGK